MVLQCISYSSAILDLCRTDKLSYTFYVKYNITSRQEEKNNAYIHVFQTHITLVGISFPLGYCGPYLISNNIQYIKLNRIILYECDLRVRNMSCRPSRPSSTSPNRITHISRTDGYLIYITCTYRYKGHMVLWNDSRFQLGLPLQYAIAGYTFW